MKPKTVFLLFIILSLVASAFAQTSDLKYSQMSESQKLEFIKTNSNRFLDNFRHSKNNEIPEEGAKEVKKFIDNYLGRNNQQSKQTCTFGDDLSKVLERGKTTAKFVNYAFAKNNLPAQLGLYVAMIESEFCPCLQSPTGSLGMFQFTSFTGGDFNLKTVKGANPQNPDERCNPKLSANAAALYFNKMLGLDFGNDSRGALFALASYNSGEGNSKNLIKTFGKESPDTLNYWQLRELILNSPNSANESAVIGVRQFVEENSKYVPKFYAALIIGENPAAFGFDNMKPLSEIK